MILVIEILIDDVKSRVMIIQSWDLLCNVINYTLWDNYSAMICYKAAGKHGTSDRR